MARAKWFHPGAFVLVVVGGAVGVAARAVVTVPLTDAGVHPLVVPAVTLAINLLGSFLLGVLVGRLDERHPLARAFLGTGMIGGFTTYSAFAVHAVTTSTASPFVGIAFIALSLFGGALCAGLGLSAGRRAADDRGTVGEDAG
ncbi:MAG: CrcB family protein [Microbacterium sp.]